MRLATIFLVCFVFSCDEPIDRSFAYWTYVIHARDYQRVNETSDLENRDGSGSCQFIAQAADSLITHIEFLEKVLLDSAGQTDPRQWKGGDAPDMERLLLIEPSTRILVGDPSDPDTGLYSGMRLRQHIAHYTELVGELDPACRSYLYTDDMEDGSGTLNLWVNVRFYHLPLITVLDELNSLKIQVRISEMEGLKACRSGFLLMETRGDTVPPWRVEW